MTTLLGIFFFIFGTIIGSFLNVVILRYNTGFSLNGRSQCFSCSKILTWMNLVPVVSYVCIKGKCSNCGSKISAQYPLVELLTGLTFLALFIKFAPLVSSPVIFALTLTTFSVIFSILIVIFVYDIRHKIIPDGLVYAFSLIALMYTFVKLPFGQILSYPYILDLLAGPILFLPFYLLWVISKGNWIGLGDGKLALGMGWLLGIVGGASAIVLSFWIGAFVSVTILLIARLKGGDKSITMKTEIPFAPFLIIGTALVFFFNIDVLGLSLLI